MSDHIPFEMQSEIMKKLPIKSLVQFRSVSKLWKSFIDSPQFIKTYHINHPNPQHRLLVRRNKNSPTYTSIIDDDTFPQQKLPLTAPDLLNSLDYTTILGSIDGLICFYGLYRVLQSKTWMVVLWNPSVRKCVGIPVSNVFDDTLDKYTLVAFGVCNETNDPKIVKINVVQTSWEVQVFTLSSRVWTTVFTCAPFTSSRLMRDHVFIDGIIYWRTSGSFLISFDLKTDKFGKVCIPERIHSLRVVKMNGSLGLLQYYKDGEMWVCGVWMRKDGVSKPFTNIYTVKVEGQAVFDTILAFRKNGEFVMQMEDDDLQMSIIVVYEPSSGRINSVGISGRSLRFGVWSYMETQLLLDESNSIIHL